MNSITTFKKYIDLLDEVYKQSSLSAVLESDATLARAGANANEIVIPKLSMQGLANYSRNSGYVNGDVTLTNETVQFNYDRGRAFSVDAMDDEETAGVAFGKLSSEFIRTKVVPELDAFRFAKLAVNGGYTVTGATLANGDDVLAAVLAAQSAMDENEVPADNRILFITPSLYNSIKALDTTKSREALEGFAQIVKVPQTRFYTAIDLLDGTTSGETAGGYAKDSDAKDINFMVVHKPAVLQFTKHTVNKVITPEENQHADAWKFCYRAYGLEDVYENKTAGIYVHTKA
ncbi:MAG: hypothetical protein MJZ72_09780 [Bacteroidales bacterium]|nr:hypothetical protein [Bacteroidales bacterium]